MGLPRGGIVVGTFSLVEVFAYIVTIYNVAKEDIMTEPTAASTWRKIPLMMKILIGFVVGIMLGLLLRENAVTYIAPLGDLFMRLLQMLVLPLVFCCIVSGITGLGNLRSMAKIGIKAFVMIIVLVALAISVGMVFGNVSQAGVSSGLVLPAAEVEETEVNFITTIIEFVPSNVFASFSENTMIQVVVFAFFFGICVLLAGEAGRPVKNFFTSASEVMSRMVGVVMEFAPFGVAGMMAEIIGQYGLEALIPLGKFLIWFHIAVAVYFIVIQGAFVALACKMNPFYFFKAILNSIIMAYATDSSAATMPVAIKELEENLGVNESIASFVMSIGTNISKSGSALYQGMVAIFIAQIVGVELSLAQQGLILFTALVSTMSLAGIPSASLVMLTLTLSCIGLPLEGITLMSGVDRILAGARTFPNVVTNCAIAKCLQKDEDAVVHKVDKEIAA